MELNENQQILEKAIAKANEAGWESTKDYYFAGNRIYFAMSEITEQVFSYSDLIYDKAFAKALWGEYKPSDRGSWVERPDTNTWRLCSDPPKNWGWEHHLQMMVIAENPLEYLREHI